jgi:hypothetical protein
MALNFIVSCVRLVTMCVANEAKTDYSRAWGGVGGRRGLSSRLHANMVDGDCWGWSQKDMDGGQVRRGLLQSGGGCDRVTLHF